MTTDRQQRRKLHRAGQVGFALPQSSDTIRRRNGEKLALNGRHKSVKVSLAPVTAGKDPEPPQ